MPERALSNRGNPNKPLPLSLNPTSLVMLGEKLASFVALLLFFFSLPLTVCCQKNSSVEEQELLKQLRDFSLKSQLPPESLLEEIERKLRKKQSGVIVNLLRAYVLLQSKKTELVLKVLDLEAIEKNTLLGDYGLWLYGKALKETGRMKEAVEIFNRLIKNYPHSLRIKDAKLLASESLLQLGMPSEALSSIEDLVRENEPSALLLAARSYRALGDIQRAWKFYRLTIWQGLDKDESIKASTELSSMGLSSDVQTQEEALMKADKLFEAKRYEEALRAYGEASSFAELPEAARLKTVIALSSLRRFEEAQNALYNLPLSVRDEAYYYLAISYASARRWNEVRRLVSEMMNAFPKSIWTAKTLVSLGFAARDAKNKLEQKYYMQLAVNNFAGSAEIAKAHFELAWLEHEASNFQVSSSMFIEHLAKYVDKDSSFRGKAGYWAARDSEKIGQLARACAIYEALIYRYHANWYGYLAAARLENLKKSAKCTAFAKDSLLEQALRNLKTVDIASENITPKEELRITRSEQLSLVGLFDWALDELQQASRMTPRSPKLNLAIANFYRLKGDNTNALLALARSYPDYAQMFPEELSKQEWAIFYPLEHWDRIKFWALQRNLDPYQVAGLIRQESVFNPRAKSSANAYGLMQLLIPTARSVARKYGIDAVITEETLYQPDLNIALGTAYLREMLDRFGRIEYAAAAYNAGPARIPQWRSRLPAEIDEFVEAIPFSETRGYVQGVIRNTAQYRRLYDENGNFRPNVGIRNSRERVVSF